MTQSAGLTRDAATVDAGDHVEVIHGVGHLERGLRIIEKSLAAKVLSTLATIDGHLARARDEAHASNGVLTTASAVIQSFTCHD